VRYQLYLNLAAAALQAGDRTGAQQALESFVAQAQGRKPDADELRAAHRMLAHLRAADATGTMPGPQGN